MMKRILSTAALLTLGACATPAIGPRVAVMPAPGKPIEHFSSDDQYCRRYAEQAVRAGNPTVQDSVASSVAGTALGAVAGAALSGNHEGAEAGAAIGLVTGAMVGARQGAATSRDAQRRYDMAYQQCMYAKGNALPGATAAQVPPRPQAAPYPPPPPGRVR